MTRGELVVRGLMHRFLFVYGTLMGGQRNDLLARIGATFVARGSIQARLYDLGRYPGARPSRDSTDRVCGEVYRLPDAEDALAVLDDYEGISKDAEKSEFVRESAQVTLGDGTELRAWVYLYNRPVDEARLFPGGDYRCKIGAVHRPEDSDRDSGVMESMNQ